VIATRRTRLVLLGCAALAVLVIAWRMRSMDGAGASAAPRVDRTGGAEGAERIGHLRRPDLPAGAPSEPDDPRPAALPASLEGTDPDGDLRADAAGHLVIDRELRRLFDYFLAASGEEPIATMRARIIAVLRARLPALAADEAIDILDRYLAYREAARQLVAPASEAAGLAQVHDLRAAHLPPAVVAAFFADEDAAIRAALARREVLADPALTPDERDRRLAEIDARTPAALREARAAAMAPLDQLARETALRAAGASGAEITAARTAALGAEAAARLGDLDRSRAAWDARLAQFRAERARLLADPRLDDAERRRRIDELLVRSFTAPERIRVDALDRMATGSAP
jgi:lipase chaperone LimK